MNKSNEQCKTWYCAAFDNITTVEVIAQTEHTITLRRPDGSGDRNKKESDWRFFTQSWDAARLWLISRAEARVATEQRHLDYEVARLDKVRALTQDATP